MTVDLSIRTSYWEVHDSAYSRIAKRPDLAPAKKAYEAKKLVCNFCGHHGAAAGCMRMGTCSQGSGFKLKNGGVAVESIDSYIKSI